MTSMNRERDTRDTDDPAIDVELIDDSTESVLAMRLGTSTRTDIERKAPIQIGHLERLLAQELGSGEDAAAREQIRKAHRLIDLLHRPAPDAPTFEAFFFLRDVAAMTRRLLRIHGQKSGGGAG
ncbi:hypothetical protein GCM10023329_06700 [Streptomyces sanyensis]|uniref:Uncharacterized protein n=2 Tax=Streptomyces TaxID=1883 RepID=A0ABP8ZR15_9ACTN